MNVDEAIGYVKQLVLDLGNSGDIEYFTFHEKRYKRMASTITKQLEAGTRILDIGSHYLHSSMILTQLGYEVHGMDVGEFWSLKWVQERASRFEITPIVQDDLSRLFANEIGEGRYDLVLFTEILEHITFNPISFWQQIHKLTKNDGLLYISTPNSLSAQGVLSTLKNLLTFKGVGNSLEMIFSKVTYGHHWKEYSYRELKNYFQMLSDDFDTRVSFYSYQPLDRSNYKTFIWSIIRGIGNWTYLFSSDLEAVVTVRKSTTSKWKLQSPEY